jgi:hypothetical protein
VKVWPAIVIVPERFAPVVFASTVNCTVPDPVPEAPLVTVIHGALLVAVQGQPPLAVTATVALPPPTTKGCVDGAIVNVHPPSWFTVTVRPPIVAVPLRTGPVFAWNSSCTVPFPVPLAPFRTPIHEALLVALHVHSAPVVTATSWVPADDGAAIVSGATPIVQPPSCVTVKVCPATVIVPDRGGPAFAATTSCTMPLPLPPAPEEMLIHPALLVAVQLHPDGTVTATDVVPPPLATFCEEGEIPYEHPAACVTVNVWPPAVIVPVCRGPVFAGAE